MKKELTQCLRFFLVLQNVPSKNMVLQEQSKIMMLRYPHFCIFIILDMVYLIYIYKVSLFPINELLRCLYFSVYFQSISSTKRYMYLCGSGLRSLQYLPL